MLFNNVFRTGTGAHARVRVHPNCPPTCMCVAAYGHVMNKRAARGSSSSDTNSRSEPVGAVVVGAVVVGAGVVVRWVGVRCGWVMAS